MIKVTVYDEDGDIEEEVKFSDAFLIGETAENDEILMVMRNNLGAQKAMYYLEELKEDLLEDMISAMLREG